MHGKLPALDDERRPRFAFDRTIHDHCPRRAHFDAGEFVLEYGDEAHRKGHCLYKLGCKGPDTHAACSTRHFNEVVDAWPIGIGAPCIGCTEQRVAFRQPMYELVQIHRFTPPTNYPPIHAVEGGVQPLAVGVVGLAAGAVAGATYVATRHFPTARWEPSPEASATAPEPPDVHPGEDETP